MDKTVETISKQTETPVSEIPAPKTRRPFHKTPILLMGLFVLLVIGAFFTGTYYQGMSANKEAAKVAVVSPTPIPASPTPDPTAGWNIYSFPAFGISFKYPSTYTIGTEGVKGTAGEVSFATTAEELAGLKQCYIPGQKPECKSYSLEVAVVVGSKKEFDSLSDFLSASTGMLPSDYDSIQFQGFPALQLDLEDQDKMSTMKKLFVDLPDKYVEFDMSSTTNLQENKKYFDLILKTLKFSDDKQTVDTSDWKTVNSEQTGFSLKIPPDWVSLVNNDTSLLSSQDYVVNISLCKKTCDGFAAELISIAFPISIKGPHFDLGKKFENGLAGLTNNDKQIESWVSSQSSSYIKVDGKNTLLNETVYKTNPPTDFVGEWCGCRQQHLYIDLGNGSILPVTTTAYAPVDQNAAAIDEIISTITFSK